MTKVVRFINKYLCREYQFVPKEPSPDTIVHIMSKINPNVLTNQEYYARFLTTKEVKDLENRAYRIYNDILLF